MAPFVPAPAHVEDVARLVPGGTEPPEEIPYDIFRAAVATFLDQRRLDMRGLATELGISRATLYRRVGGRDHLLGEAIWYLARLALARSFQGTDGLAGRDRVVAHIENFIRDVNGQPAFRHLLEAEPEASLRILTSKHGPVQVGLIEATRRLIAEEEERGRFRPALDRDTLSYVIVRICESFLYADVIADGEPDVDKAIEVIEQLLRDT